MLHATRNQSFAASESVSHNTQNMLALLFHATLAA